MAATTTFVQEVFIYAGRVREFSLRDWLVYIIWVGMMYGLFFAVGGFLMIGHWGGVAYPAYVWNIPLGIVFISSH